jgi:predicted alpha/beta-hydrolase family hydrolase
VREVGFTAGVAASQDAAPDPPVVAGGKAMGGRMTTQAQAEQPLAGVQGIALLGFPLHPSKAPSRRLNPVPAIRGSRARPNELPVPTFPP